MNHTWKLDSKGRPDSFAHDVEAETTGHNGPCCTVCGFFFCESCWPEGWQKDCPGPPPAGMEYDWIGCGTTREPEELPEPTPTLRERKAMNSPASLPEWLRVRHDRDGYLDHNERATRNRIVDICEEDLRQRGQSALDGEVDRPTWNILCVLAERYRDSDGWRPNWEAA